MEIGILKAYSYDMRLFYALTFLPQTQAAIAALAAQLTSGRNVQPEHIHLTLSFLGKSDPLDLKKLSAVLQHLPNDPLPLTITSLSSFRRGKSKTVWAKVSPEEPIYALQEQLIAGLTASHLAPTASSFVPHITLARNVRTASLPAIKCLSITPSAITLLHSYHERGVLTHTPVATLPLSRG